MARPIADKLERHTTTPEQAFGTVITRLRVKRQWSQEYVSERSGYSLRYITQVERGTQNPSLRMIRALAGVFGLPPGQLLTQAERLYLKSEKKNLGAGTRKTPVKPKP
jgi:transcriptional regulator with XRE-family HTH domain